MKLIKYSLAIVGLLFLNSCTDNVDPLNTPYINFEVPSADVGVAPNSQVTKDIKVFAANVQNSDRVINVNINADDTNLDPLSYEVPTSVTIPAGSNEGVLSVVLKDEQLDISQDKYLVLALEATADIYTGNEVKLSVAKLCDTGLSKLKVKIALDDYPEEVYWRVTNANGDTVLASQASPGFGAYAGMSGEIAAATCLPAGDYSFRIWDQYGDGAGKLSVTINGNVVFASDGKYAAGVTGNFTVQ